jgi:hypothetical protein
MAWILLTSGICPALGLFGCGWTKSDKKVDPLSIVEPRVRIETHQEFGVSTFETENVPLTLDDQIEFSKTDVERGDLSLSVISHCQTPFGSYQRFSTELPLKLAFHLFELMPAAFLFDPAQPTSTKRNCEMHFKVSRRDGATHRFDLKMADLTISGGHLDIFAMGNPLATLPEWPIVLNKEDSPLYRLPPLSDPKDQFTLRCDGGIEKNLSVSSTIDFNDFFENKNSDSLFDHSNYCRIFEINSDGRVLNLSNLLKLSSQSLRAQIRKRPNSFDFRAQSTFQSAFQATFRLTNTSAQPLKLFFTSGQAQTFKAEIIYIKNGRLQWSPFSFEAHFALNFEDGSMGPIELISAKGRPPFTIAPGESFSFVFGPRIKIPVCPGAQEVVALRLAAPSRNGGVLYAVKDPEKGLNATNVLNTYRLDIPATQWINLTTDVIAKTDMTEVEMNAKNRDSEDCY